MKIKHSIKKRFAFGLMIFLLYIASYIVFRYFLSQYYTPEWTARHILVIAAIVSIIPVFWGRIKFSLITFVGYLIGILMGELFGGFQSDIPPRFLHWGWLICIAVFFLFCIIGMLFEAKKNS
ncbi:MAG: hypothetical protein PHU23_15190 [Dehalococcoidales bacterium]|nr:hypothetical protein [Dehalococcoidales bacterium]